VSSRIPGASLAKETSSPRADSTDRYGRAPRAQDPAASGVRRVPEAGSAGRSEGAGQGRAIGVLVSGEGTNLQALIDAGLPIVAVASNTAGARALERADRAGIPTAAFELDDHRDREARDESMADWLEQHGVEFVVCAGYMHLLRRCFLRRFPGRVVNTHPAPLPEFPGPHPIDDVLAAGVPETAATVHYVDGGVDTGPVIAAERVPVLPSDDPDTLKQRVQAVEHRLLPHVVRELISHP
jgi:phosphoribosylglycinamide formyltransferase-1